jgi:phosphate transport system protein
MHLDREIELLKAKTLSLAARVEESLRHSLKSVRDRDRNLAARVVEGDAVIDQLEVALEEECLKALALYQPVARDLRFIVSVIKVTNELERIGDLAADIAERASTMEAEGHEALPPSLTQMSLKVQAMLKKSLDSLVNSDVELARDVCRSDDEVDELHAGMFDLVQSAMREQPDRIPHYLPFLSISRYLERIGDHATNIAEDVIYSVQGRIVRHVGGA